MSRPLEEIISRAEELATRFERHEPALEGVRDASALLELRQLVVAQDEAERRVNEGVQKARSEGHSWGSIGAMVGVSGDEVRRRHRHE